MVREFSVQKVSPTTVCPKSWNEKEGGFLEFISRPRIMSLFCSNIAVLVFETSNETAYHSSLTKLNFIFFSLLCHFFAWESTNDFLLIYRNILCSIYLTMWLVSGLESHQDSSNMRNKLLNLHSSSYSLILLYFQNLFRVLLLIWLFE